MRNLIEQRIEEINQWLKEVELYTNDATHLTKKERNYYLTESLVQLRIRESLEMLISDHDLNKKQ